MSDCVEWWTVQIRGRAFEGCPGYWRELPYAPFVCIGDEMPPFYAVKYSRPCQPVKADGGKDG